jgi:hypothetical protein
MMRTRWRRLAPQWPEPVLALALALVAAICATLPCVLHAERACAPDSDGYLRLGRALIFEARFANPDGTPHATRPPLYPVLTGVAQAVAAGMGAKDAAGEGCECRLVHPVIRLLVLLGQCALFLWSVRSLHRLCLRAGLDAPRATAVAAIYSLSPLPLLYVGRILSETLFVSLLLAGCDQLFLGVQRRRAGDTGWWRPATGGGVLFGLAALTRAALAPWILVWPLIWLLAGRGRAVVAVAGLSLLLSISPWLVRNHQCFGVIALNPGTGTVDYLGELATSRGQYANAVAQARARTSPTNAFDDGRLRGRVVARLIAAHPMRFAARASRGFPVLWAPPVTDLLQTAGLWSESPGTLAILSEQGATVAASRGWDCLRANASETGRTGARLWATLTVVGLFSLLDLLVTACGLAGLVLLLAGLRSGKREPPPSGNSEPLAWFPRPSRLTMAVVGTLVLVLLVGPLGIHHPRFRVPLSPGLAVLAQPVLTAGWRGVRVRLLHRGR